MFLSGQFSNREETPGHVTCSYDGWLHLFFDMLWRSKFNSSKIHSSVDFCSLKTVYIVCMHYVHIFDTFERFVRYILQVISIMVKKLLSGILVRESELQPIMRNRDFHFLTKPLMQQKNQCQILNQHTKISKETSKNRVKQKKVENLLHCVIIRNGYF